MKKDRTTLSVLGMTMGSGGAEKVISLLIPKLMNDYDVTLVLFFDVFHFRLPDGLKTKILIKKNNLSFFDKIFLFPVALLKYLIFLKKNDINVSMSFLTRPNFISGLAKIYFGNKIKVIMSERNYPSIEYRSSKLRYCLYRGLIPWLYSKADVLFSNSEWINKDLKDNFSVKTQLNVIYNPIQLPLYTKHHASNNNLISFVNVGRIFATKNQELVVNAFVGLEENYIMKFIGHGIMQSYLEEKVSKLNLSDCIRFTGNVKNVNEYLLDSDCFILSSNSEGFPNALLEAMAIGLPVISTNCLSGPLEILNDNEPITIKNGEFYIAKYGILINVGDVEGLRKAIIHVMNNRDFLLEFGHRSLERSKMYSVDKIYIQLRDLICNSLTN